MVRVFVSLFAVIATLSPAVASAQSIEGVWSLDAREVTSGDNAGTVSEQPGLLIFTGRHYSQAHIATSEPRPVLGGSATDAERVGVWGPYTSNSGTYERRGSTITVTVVVAKSPGRMRPGRPGHVVDLEIEQLTANTLVLTTTPPGGEVRYRYTRVE